LRLVPSVSMKVVGRLMNWSVSLEAIHTKRGDRRSRFSMLPALTKCQRRTESAVAQPTQDPVDPWSPIRHHDSRRSLEAGIAGAAATS
jgi:hypothetical protein